MHMCSLSHTHTHTHSGYCRWWRVWTMANQFVRAETVIFPSWPDTFTITPVSTVTFPSWPETFTITLVSIAVFT